MNLEQLRNGQKPEQLFKYLSIAYSEANSLIDYFPKIRFFLLMKLVE